MCISALQLIIAFCCFNVLLLIYFRLSNGHINFEVGIELWFSLMYSVNCPSVFAVFKTFDYSDNIVMLFESLSLLLLNMPVKSLCVTVWCFCFQKFWNLAKQITEFISWKQLEVIHRFVITNMQREIAQHFFTSMSKLSCIYCSVGCRCLASLCCFCHFTIPDSSTVCTKWSYTNDVVFGCFFGKGSHGFLDKSRNHGCGQGSLPRIFI